MKNSKNTSDLKESQVEISVTINDLPQTLSVGRNESLLDALRRASYFSVKHGCDDGTCGVCTVLLNGKPVRSCQTKAAEVNGAEITTLEGLSQNKEISPIQEAFIETGAIQCGFCTPAQILSAKSLLDKNLNPTDDEIRSAGPESSSLPLHRICSRGGCCTTRSCNFTR